MFRRVNGILYIYRICPWDVEYRQYPLGVASQELFTVVPRKGSSIPTRVPWEVLLRICPHHIHGMMRRVLNCLVSDVFFVYVDDTPVLRGGQLGI